MKATVKRVPLPEGVSAGAAIGQRGRHVRVIGAARNIRCVVDVDATEIVLKGLRSNVDDAMEDVTVLFDRILARGSSSSRPTSTGVAVATGSNSHRASFVHRKAVVITQSNAVWRFVARPEYEVEADEYAKEYTFCLHEMPGSPRHTEATTSEPSETSSMEQEGSTKFMVKASLGLTCFALRDATLANRTLSLTQLQAMRRRDLLPRWSNVVTDRNEAICQLVDQLEALARAQQCPHRCTLTVYMGACGARSHDDVTVKFHYTDHCTWQAVESVARPRRATRALYDIAVASGTAVRLRVYSKENWSREALASHVEIVPPIHRSIFRTKAVPSPTCPRSTFIRSVLIKEKVRVEYQGLCFTLSYLDDVHTQISIQCALVKPPEANTTNTVETMQELMDKVMALTK